MGVGTHRVRMDEKGDATNPAPHGHKERVNPGETSRSKARGPADKTYDAQRIDPRIPGDLH